MTNFTRNKDESVELMAAEMRARVFTDGREKVPGFCDECKGRIVKRVCSYSACSQSGYGYDTPTCQNCGKEYPNSNSARVVGLEEFQEMVRELLNREFT